MIIIIIRGRGAGGSESLVVVERNKTEGSITQHRQGKSKQRNKQSSNGLIINTEEINCLTAGRGRSGYDRLNQ